MNDLLKSFAFHFEALIIFAPYLCCYRSFHRRSVAFCPVGGRRARKFCGWRGAGTQSSAAGKDRPSSGSPAWPHACSRACGRQVAACPRPRRRTGREKGKTDQFVPHGRQGLLPGAIGDSAEILCELRLPSLPRTVLLAPAAAGRCWCPGTQRLWR